MNLLTRAPVGVDLLTRAPWGGVNLLARAPGWIDGAGVNARVVVGGDVVVVVVVS